MEARAAISLPAHTHPLPRPRLIDERLNNISLFSILHVFLVYLHGAQFPFLLDVVMANVPIILTTTLEGKYVLFEVGGVVLRSEESHYDCEGRNDSKKHSKTIQISRENEWRETERSGREGDSDVPLNLGIIGDILSFEFRTEMLSSSYISEERVFYS